MCHVSARWDNSGCQGTHPATRELLLLLLMGGSDA